MKPTWLLWIVALLIGLSVVYELATGVARARGIGNYPRRERAGAYWTVVLLKTVAAAVISAVAWLGS